MYNANILMKEYETALSKEFDKSFDRVLPVYLLPDPLLSKDKALEEIITKAQAVISEKNISNYLDEAYMLLGKANFYQDLHFSATEYFNYVSKAFDEQIKRKLNALNWKARSEIQLEKFSDAKLTIDSISSILPLIKRGKAETHATVAHFHILAQNYDLAIAELTLALKQKRSAADNDRWEYILAQLYNLEGNMAESLKYFNRVARSNAPFDLYFNANLNKINLQAKISGDTLYRHEKILALLKDDKNDGYQDQIYYKVAELFLQNNLSEAEKYLKQSINTSLTNNYQKGLSYLTLADLYFYQSADYLNAKLYYDSALVELPKNFPGLDLITKKVNNLTYLSERFSKVNFQDTLQMLASLDKAQWEPRIQQILGPEKVQAIAPVITENINSPSVGTLSGFYFNSPAAISAGFSEFRRRWGNRPLEDNWRQSSKQGSGISQSTNSSVIAGNTGVSSDQAASASRDAEIQRYISHIPDSPEKKQASDDIILNALYEIGTYYQQDLGDIKQATKIFEEILRRFPNNQLRDAIYFSLFRAYEDLDAAQAESYKNLVLSNFPNSNYAKAILDPNALAIEGQNALKVQELYNYVYNTFEEKAYPEVIITTDSVLQTYPNNNIEAQFDYLKAIAIGRTKPVDTLLQVFNQITLKHPQDSIITPLVKEHIEYINANMGQFRNREFALVDFDINDPRFLAQNTVSPLPSRTLPVIPTVKKTADIEAIETTKITGLEKATSTRTEKELTPPAKQENFRLGDTTYIDPVKQTTINTSPPALKTTIGELEKPQTGVVTDKSEAIVNDGTFSTAPSELYYYVIAVDDPDLTLSSSRFGLGQFNRSNYSVENLRHQLRELDEDQLIFVGNFADLASVRNYSARIGNQMSSIMKIPVNRYKTFIISKENFDKLTTRSRILQYITFFSTNIK